MGDAGNVVLRVRPVDLYASMQALFKSCRDDIQKSIAKSIEDIKEYVSSLSSKIKVSSPEKLSNALESMKHNAQLACLTKEEKEEFQNLIDDINISIETQYLNSLVRLFGGRRKSRRKSRRSKSKKRSRK